MGRRGDPDGAVQRIVEARVSAIIRTNDEALARDAMSAAVDGGFRVVEFTMTTPGALDLVRSFSKRSELTVGAGTVMTAAAVRDAVAAGAAFIVSPIFDPVVVGEASSLGVPTIPGAFTPTEMEAAHRGGAGLVKVFPAPPGGVSYFEAIRGPLPHLRLFPTAGFTVDNFTDFLDAGCVGVGFVKPLFDPADLAARRFDAIRSRAAGIIARLERWRESASQTALGCR
ncbi:MAG: bifunctional 4-hydroxy-2-oxoglutarate aldolase/2-dehydro-3-deoxy-phosphogluconate aldolase [Planctomycetota bacterium]